MPKEGWEARTRTQGMPTAIERRERRIKKQRKWDLRWAEANDYYKWCALEDRKEWRRKRGKANMVPCKFRVRFARLKNTD